MFEEFAKKMRKKIEGEEIPPFKGFNEKVAVEEESNEVSAPAPAHSTTVVTNTDSSASNLELKIINPQGFNDAITVADYLISGCTVVLNLEQLDGEIIKRMLDFLRGVCYPLGGEVQPVSKNTYIITPSNIDVSDK